jgi:uncharacterized membrane protein
MIDFAHLSGSIARLRWIGYGLLLFSLVDTIYVLIPSGSINALWILQTTGTLVERVAIPLLGMALVFFGDIYERSTGEKIVLRILSWLTLMLAIAFLLLIPLGLLSAARLDYGNEQKMNQTIQQQASNLKQVEDRVNHSRPEELQALAKQLNNSGKTTAAQTPETLKTEMLTRVKTLRSQLETQSQLTRSTQKQGLLKDSIRYNLAALVTSALFFLLWKSTDWARSGDNDRMQEEKA